MIHLLKNIKWAITNLPYCPDIENNYVFSKDYIEKTINIPIKLIFPIQRHGINTLKLQIRSDLKIKDLLHFIFNFYNQVKVSKNMIEKIENDVFNYKLKALEKINSNKEVHYIELIGEMIYFDGIYNKNPYEWEVCLIN
jgi:hypothetical protein